MTANEIAPKHFSTHHVFEECGSARKDVVLRGLELVFLFVGAGDLGPERTFVMKEEEAVGHRACRCNVFGSSHCEPF